MTLGNLRVLVSFLTTKFSKTRILARHGCTKAPSRPVPRSFALLTGSRDSNASSSVVALACTKRLTTQSLKSQTRMESRGQSTDAAGMTVAANTRKRCAITRIAAHFATMPMVEKFVEASGAWITGASTWLKLKSGPTHPTPCEKEALA